MKKSLILGILGLAMGISASYAGGSIAFNTYVANNSDGIISTLNGIPLGNMFTGVLLYSFTPINEGAGGIWDGSLNPGWTVGSSASFNTNPAVPNGYVQGPNLNLPQYTSGLVYFEIAAFNGPDYASSIFRGHTASFSMPMATGITIPWVADGNPLYGGSGIIAPLAIVVPEPATLALAGLGGLGLLLLRRRRA